MFSIKSPISGQIQTGNIPIGVKEGSKIVQIGTSLTDNGYQTAAESASTVGYTGRGGDAWARFLTGQNFDWVNKGVAGNQIADMVTRFSADVVAENPDVVIFEAGTNNASQSYDDIITGLAGLYQLGIDQGYIVIPLTIAMREVAGGWDDTVRDKILRVNEWIKKHYKNAIEINKYFTDPATQRPYANYTDDGTHWSNIGGHAVGKAIAEQIKPIKQRDLFGTAVNSNPLLTGTGGSSDVGITGTVPDGMHLDIVGGHSGTAVSTALENGLQVVFTAGGSASTEDYQFRTNPLNITVTATSVYELLANVTFSDWDGWAYAQARVYEAGQGSKYDLYQIMDDTTYLYPEGGFSNLMRTNPITMVGTTVRIYIEIGIDPNATGTGTFTMSKFQLQEVT